jgi:flagellar hook-associated protein 2
MGSIIGNGIGSGLDIAGLVGKLVEAEGKPQATRLDAQEAKAQAKLSALGTLRSALATFRDALASLKDLDNFRGRAVVLSGKDYLGASATTTASPGNYKVEVQELASAHRLAADIPGATPSTVVGTGTLTIGRGASSFTVELTAENSTLAGIAGAINDAATNVGVFATVVTGTSGARLVLGSTTTGAANDIVVTHNGGDGGLASLEYDPDGSGVTNLVELEPAGDALVLIDDFAVTSPTNTIDSAIEGLELELLARNELGETTLVSVGFDKEAARGTLEKFVQSYNGLVDSIASVASFDAATRQGGPLFGDAGVRNIVYQLRRELTSAVAGVEGEFAMLSEIGITTQLDGKLALDATKLDAAFAADFDAVGELFSTQDTGIAVRLDALLEPYLQSGGVFDSRNASFKSSIDDVAERREVLNQRLLALQARYTRQFNALDGLLAQLQTTSSFLSQQLGNLPGYNSLGRDN